MLCVARMEHGYDHAGTVGSQDHAIWHCGVFGQVDQYFAFTKLSSLNIDRVTSDLTRRRIDVDELKSVVGMCNRFSIAANLIVTQSDQLFVGAAVKVQSSLFSFELEIFGTKDQIVSQTMPSLMMVLVTSESMSLQSGSHAPVCGVKNPTVRSQPTIQSEWVVTGERETRDVLAEHSSGSFAIASQAGLTTPNICRCRVEWQPSSVRKDEWCGKALLANIAVHQTPVPTGLRRCGCRSWCFVLE